MHSTQHHSGDQSNRVGRRWKNLQLQCGHCSRKNRGRVESATFGFHERRARIAARSEKRHESHESSGCERSSEMAREGRDRRGDDSEGGQRSRGDRERRGKSSIRRRPDSAFGVARDFHRRGSRDRSRVMKEVLPAPTPAIVQNETKRVRELFERNVVPSYTRFDLVLERGEGSYVWDVDGKRYLDLAGGIAVCSLGHAHPEITKALTEQSKKLIHVSNLYYTKPQGQLAKRVVDHIAPGRVFFCNSGAEANEGLFKLVRKFGNQGAAVSKPPGRSGNRPSLGSGRYEIITTIDSFHGRTLAGIAATGQEK